MNDQIYKYNFLHNHIALIASSPNKKMYMYIKMLENKITYDVEKFNWEVCQFDKLEDAIDYYNKEK